MNKEGLVKDVKWLDELKVGLGWGMRGEENGIEEL